MAVVGSTPILHSDLELADLVSLVARDPDVTAGQHQSRLLDARIRLELQYRDLAESGTLYRLDIDLESALETLVARAGNEQELRTRLEEHGLGWADLEELALRVAAASAFTEQRLRPRVSVSLEEVRTACEAKQVSLHANIKVRMSDPEAPTGTRLRETTAGRVLFNEILPKELGYINETLDKKALNNLIVGFTSVQETVQGQAAVIGACFGLQTVVKPGTSSSRSMMTRGSRTS